METKLEKTPNLPYYIQLKNILKEKIKSGKIENKKLPTIRQLAKEFEVSVNTVLRAYNELRNEGIVTGSVGRGTFLTASTQKLDKENRKGFLLKIIELSMEEALAHEFSLQEFEEAVKEYVKLKLEMMQNIQLVFIECNIEQLTYFTDHLELNPHIKRVPVLLDDLSKQDNTALDLVRASDIIVTSFYHLDEVHKYLDSYGKPIIGINLEPEIKTIVEVAKIPAESVVGIITTSKTFLEIIKEILKELHLTFKDVLESHAKSDEKIKEIVSQCDVVLVSPSRKKAVASCSHEGIKSIEFVFTPDRTSINNLKVALLEIKKSII